MKTLLPISLLTLLVGPPSFAANPAAGKVVAEGACAHCHGIRGLSSSDGFPNLAGQKAAYLAKALTAYKEGTRKAPIMNGMAGNLSEQQISDVAAYYASLKP